MVSVPTFTATIYCGSSVGRTDSPRHFVYGVGRAHEIAQAYCDEVGLCVTVAPTHFHYTGGCEPGVAVGLINYPRFPGDPATIRRHALELAERLRVGLEQMRVSVVFPDETVMIGDPEAS